MTRAVAGMLTALVLASPVSADVTLKQKVSGKGLTGIAAGDTVQRIKKSRMRADSIMSGFETSTIIDADSQQLILLDHKRREAMVYDMKALAADMASVPVNNVKAKVTPTTRTRQIAGHTCTVHDVEASMMTEVGAEKMTIVLSGPACLVKNGPGQADFTAFYQAAVANGIFFGDPRAAKAQAGQSKGMTEIYRQMATLGVPLSQEISFRFEGSGAMAGMMAKMGANSVTTEVVSISTDSIPDTTFQVPEGFKIVKR